MGALDVGARGRAVTRGGFGVQPARLWDPASMGEADVLIAAPPMETACRKRHARQLWQVLRMMREGSFKAVVVEQTLRLRALESGQLFRDWVGEATAASFTVQAQNLFAPHYGSACARRRVYIVAVRADSPASFCFPRPTTLRHDLRSVLEPDYYRRGVRLRGGAFTALPQPKQQTQHCLRQVGWYAQGGRRYPVYSTQSYASTQTATGTGPGWTSGLYWVRGGVTRLTTLEVKRLMQMEDDVQLDSIEAVARRQLGMATPVGVARAIGFSLEAGRCHSRQSPG